VPLTVQFGYTLVLWRLPVFLFRFCAPLLLSGDYYLESINVLPVAASVLVMDPSEFFFLVLPLAVLVAVLVAVVLYLAKKEDTVKHTELETLHELMRNGELDKENFCVVLQGLVTKKVIDENSCERLKKLLEKAL
jgi:hypothetical protein